jgi:hypothetical protein
MDSKINSISIFYALISDYREIRTHPQQCSTTELWQNYINSLDLGIECIHSFDEPENDEYRIIDEKKWLLARLKYGI